MLRETLMFRIDKLELGPLDQARLDELVDYQIRNRERFAPFAPLRTEEFFTKNYWRRVQRRSARERRRETAFRWVLQDDGRVVAQINLDQVIRGAFQSAILGYSLDFEYEGQSYMTRSLERIIGFSFNTLSLHRICANHVPENARSAAVLKRLGFEEEGFARSYLRLNGVWRDHVLNSLINPAHLSRSESAEQRRQR